MSLNKKSALHYYFIIKILIALFAIIFAGETSYCDTPPKVEMAKYNLIKVVLDWSLSLQSFSGAYRLVQYSAPKIAHSSEAQINNLEKAFEWHVIFRWEGNNIYRELQCLSCPSDTVGIEINALYNNTLETLLMEENGYSSGLKNIKDRDSLPIPWGVYISPAEIFGSYSDGLLIDVFSSGESFLVEAEDFSVLSHINDTLNLNVDITLDKNNNVMNIEWMQRPGEKFRKSLQENMGVNILEMSVPRTSLEFDNHDLIDGIMFPKTVTKKWWRGDEAILKELHSKRQSGEIPTDEELYIALYSAPVQPYAIQIFELENAMLNYPLSKKDFQIQWPKDVVLYDAETAPAPGEIAIPIKSPFVRIVTFFIGAISILLIFVLFIRWLKLGS